MDNYEKFCETCEKQTFHRTLDCEECCENAWDCIFVCCECGEEDETDGDHSKRLALLNKLNKKIGIVSVVMSRVYEFPLYELIEEADVDILNHQSDQEIVETLHTKARELGYEQFYEEMEVFSEDVEGFVGATSQIIPPDDLKQIEENSPAPPDEEKLTEQVEYQAIVKADLLSTLSPEDLKKKLVLALWDGESNQVTADCQTNHLEILDYHFTELTSSPTKPRTVMDGILS